MSLDLSIEHRRDAMKFHIKSSSYLTMPILCLLCLYYAYCAHLLLLGLGLV